LFLASSHFISRITGTIFVEENDTSSERVNKTQESSSSDTAPQRVNIGLQVMIELNFRNSFSLFVCS
jgi:hypothetical protein